MPDYEIKEETFYNNMIDAVRLIYEWNDDSVMM
jgi:nuclear transport factor 2 (NTF2) superfamily protein